MAEGRSVFGVASKEASKQTSLAATTAATQTPIATAAVGRGSLAEKKEKFVYHLQVNVGTE